MRREPFYQNCERSRATDKTKRISVNPYYQRHPRSIDPYTDLMIALKSFECKVEGARWYHNGALSAGLTIEKVWERIEKK